MFYRVQTPCGVQVVEADSVSEAATSVQLAGFRACDFSITHASATIEPGTPLLGRVIEARLDDCSTDLLAEFHASL